MINDIEYNNLYRWTKDYIVNNCIIKKNYMPGLKPGSTISWVFYFKNGLYNHEFLSAISQLFLYKVKKEIGHFDFQLAGLETASSPMLASIPLIARVLNLNINAFSIRKERRSYATQNIIDGMPNDKPVLLIDDLVNTTISYRHCINVCAYSKLKTLDYVFTILKKSNRNVTPIESSYDIYLPKNVKIISLFDLTDFDLTEPARYDKEGDPGFESYITYYREKNKDYIESYNKTQHNIKPGTV
jgi:orotate phosphoribosyltransferase